MSDSSEIIALAQQAQEQIEYLARGKESVLDIPKIKDVLRLLHLAQEQADNQQSSAWQILVQAKALFLEYFTDNSKDESPTLNLENPVFAENTSNAKRRWEIEKPSTTKQWVAHIIPNFNLPAIITIKTDEQQSSGEFKIFTSLDLTSVSIKAEFDSEWEDLVAPLLEKINLYNHSASGFALDAIEYNLQIMTGVCESQIQFWNPVTTPFTDLEVAIWAVANMIIGHNIDRNIDIQAHREYLQIIRKNIYIRRDAHSYNEVLQSTN